MVHKSYDKLTHEIHIDNFNIDYIRYFELKNLIFNFIGSLIGIFLFYYFKLDAVFFFHKKIIVIFYLIAMFLIFIVLFAISYKAGNSVRASARLVIRRGLFSYVALTLVVILSIFIMHSVGLYDTFEKFFYIFIGSQISCAIFAVPLDFLSTL